MTDHKRAPNCLGGKDDFFNKIIKAIGDLGLAIVVMALAVIPFSAKFVLYRQFFRSTLCFHTTLNVNSPRFVAFLILADIFPAKRSI